MSSVTFNSSNYATKNNEKIILKRPKKENEIRISKIFYSDDELKESSIFYETNKIKLLEGISFNSNDEAIIKIIVDENSQDLYEFLQEIDELNIHTIWKNSKHWFEKKKQIDLEVIDELFRTIIQNKKHQTILKFKIGKSNLENLVCKNQFGKPISIKDIPINSEIKLTIGIVGVKYGKNIFSTLYNISGVKYYQPRQQLQEPENLFFTSDNEDNVFSADEYSDEELTENNYLEYEEKNNELVENILDSEERKNKTEDNNTKILNQQDEQDEEEQDEEEQNEEEQNEEEQDEEDSINSENERENISEEEYSEEKDLDNYEGRNLLLSETIKEILSTSRENTEDSTYENSLKVLLSENEENASHNTQKSNKRKNLRRKIKKVMYFNKVRTYESPLE